MINKRIIQLVLFLIIIIISTIFYIIYFSENKKTPLKKNTSDKELSNQTQNNLIKNLKYEVKLDQDNQYMITADFSEITYDNNVELVKMQKVIAIFIDKNNIPLTIISDRAIYNNSNYNTNFKDNVRIEYLDNVILADKMDLNFDKNMITIFDNVNYNGSQGTILTDVIKIDLITKKIDIYMNNTKDNVEIKTIK
ncbi:LPS export ABC transporter periplasmic protein LptC [Pelagibacterales bacterium SAG-MED24]|nr:LPS export ABC transporter periplasmic protein LptC [Pelagibacterales bacterium SAG-MED24]